MRPMFLSCSRRNRIESASRALAAIFLFALVAPAAQAQLARAYVSRNGNDANPCTRNAPCRQIDRGIQAVQLNGEVVVLNTGNFQPFTINKALTVAAAPNASPAVVTGPGGIAVTVAAGASSTVVVRGLTLRGPFSIGFSEGISGGTVGSLHVEGCTISGFGIGIGYSSTGPLSVKDTSIKSCSSGIQTSSTRALLENCRLEGNGTGLLAGVGSKVIIRHSVATDNGEALTAGGSGTEMDINDCTVSNNGDGIRSDSPGTVVRVANSVVTGNSRGLVTDGGGALLSRSPATNTVEGNTTNGAFNGIYAAK